MILKKDMFLGQFNMKVFTIVRFVKMTKIVH